MIHAITNIPAVYWLLIFLGQTIHYLNKMYKDEAPNSQAAKDIFVSRRRWIGLALNFVSSSSLLIAGYMPMESYFKDHPDSYYKYLVGVAVLCISVGGSSTFNSLMDIWNKRLNKTINDGQ